jgi:hypothetical protein
VVEGGGEEAGLQAGDAEDGLLGDTLDGEEFLGVNRVADGDEPIPVFRYCDYVLR